MQLAEVRIPIDLDGPRTLVFNLNTMMAFEQMSGRFYFDALMELLELYANASKVARDKKLALNPQWDGTDPKDPLRLDVVTLLRKVSMATLKSLVWASLHEYNENDDPKWPLSIGTVGRLITPLKVPELLNLVVQGHTSNSPTPGELGEAGSAAKVAVPAEVVVMPQPSGGAPSSELQEVDFA